MPIHHQLISETYQNLYRPILGVVYQLSPVVPATPVYRVEIPYDQSNTIVHLIDCREIPDEDLPEEGITIQP
ncbi:hypothetical protein RIVM261_053370 [Rivularia sp. IAM M-261]|nr:hypothetical protein RIVM261_053370 [Rivularia sp. IAM M-261]